MLRALQQGLGFVVLGFQVAKQKNVRAWLILPILANSLLFVAAWYWVGGWLVDSIQSVTTGWGFSGFFEFLNPFIRFLVGVVKWLVWLVLLVLLATVFTTAVQLISAPFMGFLSAKVDARYARLPLPEESLWAMSKRVLWRETVKLFYWSWRALLIFIGTALLSFVLAPVPVLNLLGPTLWFTWASWMLGIQYIDYGADNRIVPFAQALKEYRAQRWLVIGFGGGVMFLTLIPLVNLIIMPMAVVGGTLLWLHMARLEKQPNGGAFPKRLQSGVHAESIRSPMPTDAQQTLE